MKDAAIRKTVRKGYAEIAKKEDSCCAPGSTVCGKADLAEELSRGIGYAETELRSVPEGSNLGLGCGNPVALASLREGETVLDLGSGAGFDCFLAANIVGQTGKVVGVDMTPEMIEKARQNADRAGYENVEFRLGEIESLPVADNSIDIVISNCVINLSPDKDRVFEEAYRVLRPGGRMMISDIVITEELPDFIEESVEAYVGCISGAMLRDDYLASIEAAGFRNIRVVDETLFPFDFLVNDPTAKAVIEDARITPDKAREIARTISSIKIQAYKRQQTA